MIFENSFIEGVYKIIPAPFSDERGEFQRNFCSREFAKRGLDARVAQANLSLNTTAGTVRGFHFQKDLFSEAKTLTCLKGSIFDVVVDLRRGSETFGQVQTYTISDHSRESIHVPKGCANAFQTLEDDTLVHYYCSEFYSPQHEAGFCPLDSALEISWPTAVTQISEKDRLAPCFRDAVCDS